MRKIEIIFLLLFFTTPTFADESLIISEAEWSYYEILGDAWELKDLSYVYDNKNFILELVKTNGNYLSYASDRLKKDKEIVLIAVRNKSYKLISMHSTAMSIFSEPVPKEIIDSFSEALEYMAVTIVEDENAFQYADLILKRDKSFVLEVLKINPLAYQFVDKSLKYDDDILIAAKESFKRGHQTQ